MSSKPTFVHQMLFIFLGSSHPLGFQLVMVGTLLLSLWGCGCEEDTAPPLMFNQEGGTDSGAFELKDSELGLGQVDAQEAADALALSDTDGPDGWDADRIDADNPLGFDAGVDSTTEDATLDSAEDSGDTSPIPQDWHCHPNLYLDSICDCGCGASDPSCGTDGCAEPQCEASACQACYDETGKLVLCPDAPAFACEEEKLNDGVCDCGCLAKDPDCNGEGCQVPGCGGEAFDCQRCHDAQGLEISCDIDPLWYCPANRFGSGDGCDCGCGAQDPDCVTSGCTEPLCNDSGCDTCHTTVGRVISCSIDPDWDCDPYRYDMNDGCDCGCMAVDPDCGPDGCIDPDCSQAQCHRCRLESGEVTGCNLDISWTDNNCPEDAYGTLDGCDCGCGAQDPDCGPDGCTESGCSDLSCDFCHSSISGEYVPCDDWACDLDWYDDGYCDCGCGARDLDCQGREDCIEEDCMVPTCDFCFDGTNSEQTTCSQVWTCSSQYYNSNDGCDCGCGAIDPDCGSGGCAEDGCIDPACENCYHNDTELVGCQNWICDLSSYGAEDRCDCGCGAIDPDCENTGCAAVGCDAPGCETCYDEFGRITPCPAWICSPLRYLDDRCDCGCLAIDPDCGKNGCQETPCDSDQDEYCDYCYDTDGNPIECGGWTCSSTQFYDEQCDCGCGGLDPACNDQGCIEPGCRKDACEMCRAIGGQLIDCDWSCDPTLYNADNGCDCGCAAIDPECDPTLSCTQPDCYAPACDICHDLHGSPLEQCQTSSCDPDIIGGGDGCDCGCGGIDPDCAQGDGCGPVDCIGKNCDRCFDEDGDQVSCWSCPIEAAEDSTCDCGCGVIDPACGQNGCSEPDCVDPECDSCHDKNGELVICEG